MQNLFKLSFVLLFASVSFGQVPTDKQDQYNRFKTRIINGGFENGTSQWSASGGTLTANTTLSNVRSGLRSGSWDATAASQTLTSAANTVSAGNAQVSCWFMTTATDYEFAAYDGTNKLVAQTIPATTVFQKITLNYALSSAGQLRARITSASNAAVLYIDDCFAGEADNVGNGNLASDFTSYTPAINITTNVTSSGKWRRVGDSIDLQLGIDFSGSPTAFSTMEIDLPTGLTFDSNKLLSTTSLKEKMCFGTYHDPAGGTTDYALKGSYVDSNTIRVRWLNDLGSLSYENNDVSNSSPATAANGTWVRLNCQNLPIAGWGSVSVWDPNINPAYWSGYHAADCTWTSSTSTYGDFASGDATCTFTEVVNNNFGTVSSYQISGNNGPGLVFTPTRSGVYEVCADIMSYGPASSGTRQGFHLYDGTNVIAATEFQTQSASQNVESHHICGYVNASSIASKTYRLQAISASGTITVGPTTSGALAEIYWTIKQLSAVATAPLIQGNVVSNSTTAEKINRAKIIMSGGTPTINTQSGSWLSSISDFGVGDYRMNFVSGIWSAVPSCVVTAHDDVPNGDDYYCVTRECTGTSNCRVECWNRSSGALVDHSWDVICMGPK